MTRRTNPEVLEIIYARSAQIRGRRRTTRLAALAGAMLLLAGMGGTYLMASSDGGVRPPLAAPIRANPAGPTSTAGPPPTACACALPATVPTHTPAGRKPSARPRVSVEAAPGVHAPSTTRFAFASNREGSWQIYTMNIDGSHLRRVTDGAAAYREPSWSPDGKHIAFTRLAENKNLVGEIEIMDSDGSHVRDLTAGGRPQWSPDGQRIVYHNLPVYAAPTVPLGSIWIVGVDGSDPHQIASSAMDPVWTRDGRHVVYGGVNSQAVTNVHMMDDSGNSDRQLTFDPHFACRPAVSSDGKFIAFIAQGSDALHLEVMQADGSDQRRLTQSTDTESVPAWSPDGTVIAIERGAQYDDHATPDGIVESTFGQAKLVLVNADGSGEVVLSKGGSSDADPAFAPRGP